MARIRTVKPEFWTSEQVVECSPNARLLLIGMLNFCDDAGIHPANVRRLQMEVFPCGTFGKSEVSDMVGELINNELVEQYEVDGQQFWIVTGFSKHQKIDQPTYKYPLPDGNIPEKVRRKKADDSPNENKNSPNTHRAVDEGSDSVHPRKGKEGKGRESNNPPAPRNGGVVNADRFQRFWEAYPLKKAIGQAEKTFAKINPDDLMLNRMIKALQQQVQHREKLQSAGQFVPELKHPSTWLNARSWEDELEPVQQRPLAGTYLSAVGSTAPTLQDFNFED